MEKLYTVRLGADCGLDHELPTAKFSLKLKKVPCDYTVDVTNRLKGLDLIDIVPEELWNEACNIVQEAVTKTIPKKKKCRKAKWLSDKVL